MIRYSHSIAIASVARHCGDGATTCASPLVLHVGPGAKHPNIVCVGWPPDPLFIDNLLQLGEEVLI